MTIASLYARRNELNSQIEAMAGKKGVGSLRQELEAIKTRLASLDMRRHQMKMNVNGQNAVGRSSRHIEDTRRTLERLAICEIRRGGYDELVFRAGNDRRSYWNSWDSKREESLSKLHPTHPNALPFAAWNQAWRTLNAAIDDGVIPEKDAAFDKKGRGTATNHDMYSYSHDGTLILVQVRHAEVSKYGTNVKIQYYVTDGDDCIEIVKGKGNIKRAAQTDPSPDSPLRFLRSQLKAEWQVKLSENPVRLTAPKATEYEVYKILHNDNGTLKSVYNGEVYTVGKSKVQKARDEHGGGYYAFLSQDTALKVFADGKAFNSDWTEGKTFVLCKGKAFGKPVVYSNGKRSFSRLVITEVLQSI